MDCMTNEQSLEIVKGVICPFCKTINNAWEYGHRAVSMNGVNSISSKQETKVYCWYCGKQVEVCR